MYHLFQAPFCSILLAATLICAQCKWGGNGNNTPINPGPTPTNPNPQQPPANYPEQPIFYQADWYGTKVTVQKVDMLSLKVDAIVNAANEGMLGGGGIDGKVTTAGGNELAAERQAFPDENGVRCPTGEARITKAYGTLKSTYIIHAVGPDYRITSRTADQHKKDLTNAYKNTLELAIEGKWTDYLHKNAQGIAPVEDAPIASIAFPGISVGIFKYPQKEAAHVVAQVFNEVLKQHGGKTLKTIVLTVYGNEANTYGPQLQAALEQLVPSKP